MHTSSPDQNSACIQHNLVSVLSNLGDTDNNLCTFEWFQEQENKKKYQKHINYMKHFVGSLHKYTNTYEPLKYKQYAKFIKYYRHWKNNYFVITYETVRYTNREIYVDPKSLNFIDSIGNNINFDSLTEYLKNIIGTIIIGKDIIDHNNNINTQPPKIVLDYHFRINYRFYRDLIIYKKNERITCDLFETLFGELPNVYLVNSIWMNLFYAQKMKKN